jgi:hypothetical protein
MNIMKRITTLKFAGAALMIAGMLTFNSCTSDPCKDVTCVNGTATADGDACDCVCEDGYEGANCDVVSRDKFLAIGKLVTETCGSSNSTPYPIDIITGTDVNQIRIKNLGGYNCSGGTDYYVDATVDGDNITIAQQSVTTCGTTFSGSGSISGSTVTISYHATNGALIDDSCEVSYSN